MPSHTLFEYYRSQGRSLPPILERAQLWENLGLGKAKDYTGSVQQNPRLLSALQAKPATAPGATADQTAKLPPIASVTPPTGTGVSKVSDLGNLRIALRDALNEAGRERQVSRLQQTFPLAEGVPGSLKSIVDMVRGSVRAPVESVFKDVLQTVTEEFQTTKNFALTMASKYIDAGVISTDTPEIVLSKIQQSDSYKNEQSKAPDVIDTGENGYYQWNSLTKSWEAAKGIPRGGVDGIPAPSMMDVYIKDAERRGLEAVLNELGTSEGARELKLKITDAYYNVPRVWEDEEIRRTVRNARAKNQTYQTVIDEFSSSSRIANKDRARFIAAEMFGVIAPGTPFEEQQIQEPAQKSPAIPGLMPSSLLTPPAKKKSPLTVTGGRKKDPLLEYTRPESLEMFPDFINNLYE
jgi:RNAse (barnase) inhibitor barstar